MIKHSIKLSKDRGNFISSILLTQPSVCRKRYLNLIWPFLLAANYIYKRCWASWNRRLSMVPRMAQQCSQLVSGKDDPELLSTLTLQQEWPGSDPFLGTCNNRPLMLCSLVPSRDRLAVLSDFTAQHRGDRGTLYLWFTENNFRYVICGGTTETL